ncbi:MULTISPECIES: AAA family ATPase [unclassified Providencia]|uniref:AAA family ATPase n=1 Tax=unclassified Providencia TaxID=2633465 RepID=UPI002349753D|nr:MULTISPECIES: AAA family ATPase [unclassified Providencia]
MYLESLKIVNYRKFRTEDNVVHFVEPCSIEDSESDGYSGIGPSTTLIIGKNNVGKTTIVNALKMVCENQQPKAADFNVQYLKELFEEYLQGNEIKSYPELEFKLVVNVDFDTNDLLSVLNDFMPLENSDHEDIDSEEKKLKNNCSEENKKNQEKIEITVKVEISEQVAFGSAIKSIIKSSNFSTLSGEEKEQKIIEMTHYFYELLDQNSDHLNLGENKKLFEIKYYDSNERKVSNFYLKNLINLKEIKANRHLKDDVLSNVFNKIISYYFDNDKESKKNLKNDIYNMNKGLTDNVDKKSDNVSSILEKIEGKSHVGLKLLGNITYDGLIKNLIKYNFSDDGDFIPENQFGLGYINLLNIIGEIIYYVDSYENGSQNSRINLLCIEEPEVFMHPQMQEFFIKRIDDAIKEVLSLANENEGNKKKLNCQITITTHSSHIVNSKIHSSNSFNNINYVTVLNKSARVINLHDSVISKGIKIESNTKMEKNNNEIDDLKFIKKHIKYKVSELFFSDAVIFVEGATEETLLQYYLEKDKVLSEFYISVFNINGAHGKVYFSLAKILRIPCLVITDLDIKRSPCQKGVKHKKSNESCHICGHIKGQDNVPSVSDKMEFLQISDLKNFITTNKTISYFNEMKYKNDNIQNEANENFESLENIDYFEDENIYVVFQKDKVSGYYATSLEEAFILSNFNNDILNDALKQCKPDIYKEIIGKGDKNNLKENSFKLQSKLSDSKNNFSSELLYRCIISDDKDIPNLPKYIIDGFKWLKEKLNDIIIQKEA